MRSNAIYAAYAQSLEWLAVLAAIVVAVSNIVALMLVDFVHDNPNRMWENAIGMMVLFTPLFGMITVVGTLLVFTLPQCFQAVVSSGLVRRFGSQAHMGVLLVLPVTAVITWYCYDYLIAPFFSLGLNEGPDWRPYQHGMTATRYLGVLAFQAPATLFSAAYAAAGDGRLSRRIVLLLALTAAVVAGGITGHRQAEQQYQFLRGSSAQ